MASKIQIARGDLHNKQKQKPLVPSELFWIARTSDDNNKNEEFTRWDEGTLYVGRPSLNLQKLNEKPVPIAGARTYFSVVSRGYLSEESSIADQVFKHAMVGDLYIWSNDAKDGIFHTLDDFRKDDLLLILDIGGDNNKSPESGEIYNQSLIKYKRINSSGGYADDVYFTQDGKEDGTKWINFDATNVQDALLELNWEKGQYCGTINTNAQIPVFPNVVIGGVYLVTSDGLDFNAGTEKQFSPDKGDFVFWSQPINTDPSSGSWIQIPSGYTNADEIDYYDNNKDKDYFISQLFTTFKSDHIDMFKTSSDNVHNMLDFLMAQKAQLDEQGKIPLSQLHDTVLGALQFRGVWNPLKPNVNIERDIDATDGKMIVKKTRESIVNDLPGLVKYEDGDTTGFTYKGLNDGDYYVVQCQDDVLNLQYIYNNVNFELNTGDWIVWQSSKVVDDQSEGMTGQSGFWSKIDNTDRLSAMQFNIDVSNRNNFFVTRAIDESVLTLVGTPKIVGKNKIGIENLGNNTVAIEGRGLIDQLQYENPLPNFLVRYDNTLGTVKTSFIEEVGGQYDGLQNNERTDHIRDIETDNKTIIHSNLSVGSLNEVRHQKNYGDITLTPHITSVLDKINWDKSIVKFEVDAADDNGIVKRRTVGLVPPSGLSADNGFGVNEDKADFQTNIILPEHTSTLIGKLAGVEFEEKRILKSTTEGYAETSSIEEHINSDDSDQNHHDSIHNIVEFHSQITAPISNSFEYYFGDWNTTEQGPIYDNNDIDDNGNLKRKWGQNFFKARLVKNTNQINSNITVMLPTRSGTIITEEFIQELHSKDDDTYLTMFGTSQTLDTGNRMNTLQKSPLRQIQNALRTRLIASKIDRLTNEADNEIQRTVAEATADEYAKSKNDGSFKPTVDTSVSDTVVENDLIAGVFNDDGSIKEKKSIVATRAIGVSDPDYGTGLIQGARQNFPDAEQYLDPATGEPTVPIDVVVDLPNESGVMLTSNSVISGGVW